MCQLADFLHMMFSVGTADKNSTGTQNPGCFAADGRDIIAVKQNMVCNHKIKRLVWKRNIPAVKRQERKTAVLHTDISADIADHAIGNVREDNPDIIRKLLSIFRPECAISTAKFQNILAFSNFALVINPGKPTPAGLWNTPGAGGCGQRYLRHSDTGFSCCFPCRSGESDPASGSS